MDPSIRRVARCHWHGRWDRADPPGRPTSIRSSTSCPRSWPSHSGRSALASGSSGHRPPQRRTGVGCRRGQRRLRRGRAAATGRRGEAGRGHGSSSVPRSRLGERIGPRLHVGHGGQTARAAGARHARSSHRPTGRVEIPTLQDVAGNRGAD
jgi:hypothetical protein